MSSQPSKKKILSALNAELMRHPNQQKNVEAMIKFMDGNKRLPNSLTPVLYAIDGNVGLANASEFGRKLAEKPNATWHAYHWNVQLMGNHGSDKHSSSRHDSDKHSSSKHGSDKHSSSKHGSDKHSSSKHDPAKHSSKPSSSKPSSSKSSPEPEVKLSQSAKFGRSQEFSYAHEIYIEYKFDTLFGGDGTVMRRAATLNDTGSNVQNLRRSDWNALNTTFSLTLPGTLETASGVIDVENIIMEIRVVKYDPKKNQPGQGEWKPLTPWFVESLRIVEDNETVLSGESMRNYLYFATTPGNDYLLVTRKKQALIDGLS